MMRQITDVHLTFISAAQITKDDPDGKAAYFAWKAMIGGIQYGQAMCLGAVDNISHDEFVRYSTRALNEIAKIRRMTPAQIEATATKRAA